MIWGAAHDVQCDYGIAPIHLAVMKGHHEVVCMLVRELGVAVVSRDNNGDTVLHYASHFNRSSWAPLLRRRALTGSRRCTWPS